MAVARLKAASLPVKKALSGFDFSAASSIPRLALEYRPSLEWLRAKEWPCLVGPPGTGKSHVVIALGHATADAGYTVRYVVI
jgi:DNA replication protein DnaC